MAKCLNPVCENTFDQPAAGRPKEYCSAKCRSVVWNAQKAEKKAQNVVQIQGIFDAPEWVKLMIDYFAKTGAKAEDLIECHSAAVAKVKIGVKSEKVGGFKVGEKVAGGGVIHKVETTKEAQVAHVKPVVTELKPAGSKAYNPNNNPRYKKLMGDS